MIALFLPAAIALWTSGQVRSSMYTERWPRADDGAVNKASSNAIRQGSAKREVPVIVVSPHQFARTCFTSYCRYDQANICPAAARRRDRAALGQPECDA